MATLEELRAQLDGIDNEIIELYKKRMDVCMEIGDIKISEGNKVFDKQREREKLAAVAAKVTEEFHKKGVQELFEQAAVSAFDKTGGTRKAAVYRRGQIRLGEFQNCLSGNGRSI